MHLTPGLLDSESSKSLLHPLRIPITRCWKTVTQVIWIWQKCLYDTESRKRKKSRVTCHSIPKPPHLNHKSFPLPTRHVLCNISDPIRRTMTSTVNIQKATIQKVRPVRTSRCTSRSETWRKKSPIMTTRNRSRRICCLKGKVW